MIEQVFLCKKCFRLYNYLKVKLCEKKFLLLQSLILFSNFYLL